MKRFVNLTAALDETTTPTEQVAAMVDYFQSAAPADAMWAAYFLSGRKLRPVVPVARLRAWAVELSQIPDWLFDECHQTVGDLAETIALVLPASETVSDRPLSNWVEEWLMPLPGRSEDEQQSAVLAAWRELDARQRFVWNTLLTGGIRVSVAPSLVVRALAAASNVAVHIIAHRLSGEWQPTAEFHAALINADADTAAMSQPYPFSLARPLEIEPASLGPLADWQAEWKWDGLRVQVIRRGGESLVWTRGEELVNHRFPELQSLADRLPDGTAIDGEILPWKDGVLAFADLQRRIGRKTLGRKLLADVPVILMAYDLLESDCVDLRDAPLTRRRKMLESLVAAQCDPSLMLSPRLAAESWDALAVQWRSSRARRVEGLMLKRLASPYGRDWWTWRHAPLTVDAVLMNAQPGQGRGLFTDYTFGVWDGGKLVPLAKANSGLTDAETRAIDEFVRANATEKFGPVRTLKPELVFELGFDGIQASTRHKSGVVVRAARILRWCRDKPATEADTLDAVKTLVEADEKAG